MINIPMNADGPDMDMIEKLAAEDESIKGVWCVPMYGNPTGITFSDEVVKRFANMKTKAADFRIFWDNAYCVHHLSDDHDVLLDLLAECAKAGNPDRAVEFASTSKITYAGAGVAMMASSEQNISYIKSLMSVQTIGPDKINQLRHVKFFKNFEGLTEHMKKHQALLAPRFAAVLDGLDKEIAPYGIGSWTKPNGGYFVSIDVLEGTAKRVVALCREAGLVLTGAGATYPNGFDPKDANIRIAPSFPPNDELQLAMDVFCICVKLAAVEKLLEA
jgi:DNA-binding transcriptional MocR family regulator